MGCKSDYERSPIGFRLKVDALQILVCNFQATFALLGESPVDAIAPIVDTPVYITPSKDTINVPFNLNNSIKSRGNEAF